MPENQRSFRDGLLEKACCPATVVCSGSVRLYDVYNYTLPEEVHDFSIKQIKYI